MPYDVVEALGQPDATLTPQNLIDLPGWSTFDLLKHLAEGVRIDYPKDGMYMIGHYDGSIQIDCFVVLFLNHGHYEITRLRGKLESRMTAKRDEVGSSRYF